MLFSIAVAVLVALGIALPITLMARWEFNNAGHLRAAREARGREDKKHFERDLTPEAIEHGAR